MPLTRLQSHLLRLLAGQRSPESYIAGAIAINRDGPRFSSDIDIFHDGDERLLAIAEADAAIIVQAGVDLVTIHQKIMPLGAVITAAVGRFSGMTPEEMLSEIRRHSSFTADEFRALAMERPIEIRQTHQQIRAMLDDAERFIIGLPSDAVGFLFLDGETPVQPDPAALDRYIRHAGTRRGHWPSSSDIGSVMLERYGSDPA